MDSEKLKQQIGANIAAFRRQMGITQAELAEKLNYTDKAVSKWERGESVPDVMTLVQVAELFSVSLDELTGLTEIEREKIEPARVVRKANKSVVLTLASLLVWFVAMLVYVVLASLNVSKSWIGFLYAIPANAIVILCLRSAWRKFNWNFAAVSLLVWSCLVALYVTLLVFWDLNIWRLFLLGVPGQAAVCLWFRLFRTVEEDNDE
jgi:transcriptional regulator with XRE-family HTH domain